MNQKVKYENPGKPGESFFHVFGCCVCFPHRFSPPPPPPTLHPQVLIGLVAPISQPCLVPVSRRWSQASRPRRARLGPKSPSAERTWAQARLTSLVNVILFSFKHHSRPQILTKICSLLGQSHIFFFSLIFFRLLLPPNVC